MTQSRLVEDLVLLLLSDNGHFIPVQSWVLRRTLVAAVLMDLALEDRIDTDLDSLILVDATPVGCDLLDSVLSQIAQGEQNNANYWVGQLAGEANEIRAQAIERLIQRGVLNESDDGILWGLHSISYSVVDDRMARETKTRIIDLLFNEEIPDPRDVMIISLADACHVFDELLSPQDLERVSDRIKRVRTLDLISQAMFRAIKDISIRAG